MLKNNILILLLGALSGVHIASGMDYASIPEKQRRVDVILQSHAQESEDHSTISTQEGKDFRVPDRLLRLSQTLRNLMEDVGSDTVYNAISLPTITSKTWQFIESQLQRLYELNPEAEKNIKIDLQGLASDQLIEVIAAVNYLDVSDLLRLAIDVAKGKNIEEYTFEQFNILSREIRNLIILGQAVRLLGPGPVKQVGICNGHTNSVDSVCVTQDGTTIVSGSFDNTVRIWNKDGTQQAVCSGHTDAVRSVCVSQDGTTIVSGSCDRIVRIWNKNGTQRAVCNGHTDAVYSVCVSQDGNTIVSGSYDGTVRIWNKDGTQHAVCNGHTEAVRSVCVSQDGTTIVSGSYDGTVRIWNKDGTQRAICNGHTRVVNSVYISQDGNTIVSASHDGTVRIWNRDGTQRAVSNGHTCDVNLVCVLKDGNTIVLGSSDSIVRIWNKDGTQRAECNDNIRVANSLLCISQDGTTIISGSDGGIMHIWNINWMSNMSAQQAQAIWQYLQSNHAKDWKSIQTILEPVS